MTLNEFSQKYLTNANASWVNGIIDNITKYPNQNVYDALYKEYKDETGGQYSTEKLNEVATYIGSLLNMSGQDFLALFESLRATYNTTLNPTPIPAPKPAPVPDNKGSIFPNPIPNVLPAPTPAKSGSMGLILAAGAALAAFFFLKKK